MASEQRGPFDRLLRTTVEPQPERHDGPPDRAAIYVVGTIIGLAILLLVLVLPPVSILSGDGESEIPSGPGVADTLTSRVRSGMPKLPPGLVSASAMFDLAAPEDQRGASAITVPLKEQQTEARTLGLYTYVDGNWQRLGDVTLVGGGTDARAEVSALPGNVAVLRRSQASLIVAGSVAAGHQVSGRAASALTTLHPIVFIPADDGSLAGTPPAVPPASYNVVPTIITLSPEVVDNILRSADLRARHATAIADAVKQGNYEGINIDYRSVNPQLRAEFTNFIELVDEALEADSRSLTVTLPMPRSEDGEMQTGAYDWAALGRLADTIEMAGELDQELYFQNTEAALEYVVEQVEPSKVLLGVSALSIERGGDGLRTMPLDEALGIAAAVSIKATDAIVTSTPVQVVAQNLAVSEGASGLHWDDVARSVTFSYPGRGGKRTVWIANEFSVAFRIELAKRFGLGGIAVNDVSVEGGSADIWTPVQQATDTGDIVLSKPNGQLFVPAWSANAGAMTPPTGDAVTWSAPGEPGTYEITITVSDGVVRAGRIVQVDVSAPPAADGQ